MNSKRNWHFPFFGLLVVVYTGSCTAPTAMAGDSAAMKCAANQERIWVYESLGSFDVTAKLKCGETVEIVGRVKGFVKVHSASGVEGYVPESTFPNLPPFEDDSNKTAASASTLAQAAAKAHARSAVAAPAPASVASNLIPVAAPVASSVAAQPAAAAAPVHARAVVAQPVAQPAESAPVEIVLSTGEEKQPAGNVASPATTSVASVAAASVPPSSSASSVAAPAKKTTTSAANASAQPSGVNANARTASTNASTVNSSAKTSASNSNGAKTSSKSSGSQPPAAGSTHSSPAAVPAAPATIPSNSKAPENTASVQPPRAVASMHPVAATVESEDFPDSQPANESADPACQIYFSAYGLTPDQFKWVAQNRKKKFPNACPAPDTSQVDFVIIFTHDVDFYGNTLPGPVHTDKNGFSDFSPMSMMDTTATPISEAEKARREFVYVFKMKRGAFDPARFSPRRRYQFTKAESNSLTSSHASSRTVEDAFRFMEEQGPSQ
jgi:hypothetical protein